MKSQNLDNELSFYDEEKKVGWLFTYTPYSYVRDKTMPSSQWNSTNSPLILRYKEGKIVDIRKLATPMLELINTVLEVEGYERAFLVPVPTSIPKGSSKYSTKPSPQGGTRKNRDNRNILFCEYLAEKDPRLQAKEILERANEKQEKDKWSAEEHARSLELNGDLLPSEVDIPYILIDDLRTDGGTLEGCKRVLSDHVDPALIIQLSVAKTEALPIADPFAGTPWSSNNN